MGNLTSLQTLDLSYNKLTTLPESMGNLSSLKKLDLRNNELNKLPKSLKNLRSLNEVNLRHNPLAPKDKSPLIRRIYVIFYVILGFITLPILGFIFHGTIFIVLLLFGIYIIFSVLLFVVLIWDSWYSNKQDMKQRDLLKKILKNIEK